MRKPNEIVFARRLSRLLGAHIDLEESIGILASSCARKEKKFYEKLSKAVSFGATLSSSLKESGSAEPITIALVRIGEESGSLAVSLAHLAEELGKRDSLRKKMLASLIYPASIASATLALSSFLVFYIFPKIKPIFLSLKIELPWTTRLLIFSSDLVTHHYVVLILAFIAVVLIPYAAVKKIKRVREQLETMYIQIPLISKIITYSIVSALSRRLGILLSSGMPIDLSLALIADTVHYQPYKEACAYISEQVSHGSQLSANLKHFPLLFPNLMVDTCKIGELTGSLAESCKSTADYYELEVDDLLKKVSGLLEPILMVSMGCIVGFIALSIITPLYALTQNVG